MHSLRLLPAPRHPITLLHGCGSQIPPFHLRSLQCHPKTATALQNALECPPAQWHDSLPKIVWGSLHNSKWPFSSCARGTDSDVTVQMSVCRLEEKKSTNNHNHTFFQQGSALFHWKVQRFSTFKTMSGDGIPNFLTQKHSAAQESPPAPPVSFELFWALNLEQVYTSTATEAVVSDMG